MAGFDISSRTGVGIDVGVSDGRLFRGRVVRSDIVVGDRIGDCTGIGVVGK